MDINPIWLVIAILATWRMTNIVTEEKIFEPLRKGLGSDGIHYPDSFFGYLVSCFYCFSVWAGVICTLLYIFFPYPLLPLALSAVSIFLKENVSGERNG
jgi:hypothetical protein